ncbi:MAG: bifunctional demethylmenaquinone methyltransferase/2-methoxy-6-polyprenyl-1,4-benzoquinol methylase UbiE [Alphaproteobacteria bacterium]
MGSGESGASHGGREKGGEETADFGYRTVRKRDKAALVQAVFDTVARRYDLMNDLMSMGVHRLWKHALIDMLAPRPGTVLVDVAGGTGDVAFRFLERCRAQPVHKAPLARAVVCDPNQAMMSVGRDRAIDQGLAGAVDWVCGAAERLPFADRRFDAYTIAFGLRNVTDIDAALKEARRVLKPGGRFLCLEFSHVDVPLLAPIYDRYSFDIVPKLGEIVTGRGDAYRYLVESIRRFPDQEGLAGRMRRAGFSRVRYVNLTGGIAAIHSAWRI